MATSPVTFDPSTEQPVNPSTANSVSFDPSTEQPTQSQSSGIGGLLDRIAPEGGGGPTSLIEANLFRGGVKSLSGGLGHILNFVTKAPSGQTVDPNTVRGHVNDAAQWLLKGAEPHGVWENVGAIGEQTGELLTGEGLLGLASRAPAAAGVVDTMRNLKVAQKIGEFFKEHKVIAGLTQIGLNALKDATEMGAQTYAHTEDSGQATSAAVLGGTLGAGTGAIAQGAKYLKGVGVAAEAAKAAELAEEAKRNRTTTLDVGGKPVTVLPSQVTPEGGLTGVTATGEGRPDVAATQQQDLQDILQNKAQTSLAGVLDRANQTRTVQFERAAEPQYFQVGEGENASWAEKRVPKQITENPLEAEAWLHDIERRMREPDVSESTFAQLSEMHKSLEDQLGMHHSSAQVGPLDIQGAVASARSFGDAGAQTHGAARDIFQMISKETNGEFTQLRDAEKKALSTIGDYQASAETISQAQQDLENIQGRINQLFDSTRVNPNDAKAARELYRDGLAYKQLNAIIEHMSNGISLGDTESGLKRVVTGNNKMFENFLAKGNNRATVARLIGDDGITDLKTMFQLTSDAKIARKTAEVVDNVADEGGKQGFKNLLTRYGKPGEALILANAYGHILGAATAGFGGGYGQGARIGAGIGLTHFLGRQILDSAAANGRVINMIDFAVRNNLDPRMYAPLIARAIMTPQQEQPPEATPKPAGGNE